MITPFFTVNQDDEFIYIDVKISHIRFNAKTIEMVVDKDLFVFSLAPYYLRLRFPYSCVDDERSNAEFDSKSESVKIKIAKEITGQHFPDLDLGARLLARTSELAAAKPQEKPLIAELDVDNNQRVQNTKLHEYLEEGEQFNWEIDQQMPEDSVIPVNKYGFNNEYHEIIGVSVSNTNDINELGDPENTPATDRIIERLIKENVKFDPEYYAADYIMEKYPTEDDDKNFKGPMEWKSPLVVQFLKWYKSQQALPKEERQSFMPVEFAKEEQEKMMGFPQKTYLIEPQERPKLFLLVVSLLFAYHFDLRENQGDHTVESAWTIGKLTPQFAYLDANIIVTKDNALRAAIITSIRRALSYPLHRNYKLVQKVWDDVYYNLRGGKRLVLKALIALKELFRFHDVYYVYDRIWLQDLCSWLLSDEVTEMSIRNLAHDLKREVEAIQKTNITFEKPDDSQMDADSDDEEESDSEHADMIALNLQEIEFMAEEAYSQYNP